MKIEIEIDDDVIRDTLISALEGGSNYWYRIYGQAGSDAKAKDSRDQSHPAYVAMAGGEVNIEHTDGDGTYLREPIDSAQWFRSLTIGSIRDGLAVMAAKYGRCFGDMISQSGDATTGDVLLQCCVFGELVYG